LIAILVPLSSFGSLCENQKMRNAGLFCYFAVLLDCSLSTDLCGIGTPLAFGFFLSLSATDGETQWTPPPSLQKVPVRQDCAKTNAAIGLALQPSVFQPHGAIFLCPKRALEIDRAHPRASFFFRVHEYGHLALHTRNEALADGWAAEQLSHSVSGRMTLNAVFAYFTELGKRFAPMYGTGYDRALTVATSGQIPHEQLPRSLAKYQRDVNEKRARNGAIHLRTNDQAADGLLWIDDQLVGFVSTAEAYRNPPVPDLLGRTHRLRLQDVWVSQISGNLVAHGIDASAVFEGSNSADGLKVNLDYQAGSLSLSVSNGQR
jgi:hypothetical protein